MCIKTLILRRFRFPKSMFYIYCSLIVLHSSTKQAVFKTTGTYVCDFHQFQLKDCLNVNVIKLHLLHISLYIDLQNIVKLGTLQIYVELKCGVLFYCFIFKFLKIFGIH